MANLQDPLQESAPLNPQTRNVIIDSFWPISDLEKRKLYDWDPYFAIYASQCRHAIHDRGRHIIARTHQDIIDIVHHLEARLPRASIKDQLRPLFTTSSPHEDEILDNSIDLAARLYLMINIGVDRYTVSGQKNLLWRTGDIKDFLAGYFDQPPILGNSGVKLEKTFTARNMDRVAGIKIQWTENLVDHLRMVDSEDKVVAVFGHTSFLRRMNSHLYPPGLIEETLRTLTLLFPQHDSATQKWLKKLPDDPLVDRTLAKCGHLRLDDRQIETYRFWHDRLVILKQAYDQSRPSTLSQWWHDRRNGVQWYTFWVAVLVLFLTIIFGMTQSIEGALQTYKAFHPNRR